MKQVKAIFSTLLVLISMYAIYLALKPNFWQNQSTDIQIGEKYLYSHDWDSQDPFEDIKIDTVKVLNIKGDYVQWGNSSGYKTSNMLKFFKHNIRLIK